MSVRLRVQVLEIVKHEKVLNSTEVCRLVNGRAKDDYDYCYRGQGFTFGTRGWGKGFACNGHNCKVDWRRVYDALRKLQEMHYLHSRRMRFFDGGPTRKGKATDIFRFWFIHPHDFGERVLRQTLIPYVEEANK